jgi:hypothetical protein
MLCNKLPAELFKSILLGTVERPEPRPFYRVVIHVESTPRVKPIAYQLIESWGRLLAECGRVKAVFKLGKVGVESVSPRFDSFRLARLSRFRA